MTPDQAQLAADHVGYVTTIVRRGRWNRWSEAESEALELLCQAACRDDGAGRFEKHLGANMDWWLAGRYRVWTHSHRGRRARTYAPTSLLPLHGVDPADETRAPDERVSSADAARRELGVLPARTVRIAHLVASGMKKEDIAVELGVSPSAVSQALRFGRERIESYRRAAV